MASENMFDVVKRGFDQDQVLEYVEKLELAVKKQKMAYESKIKQMEAQVEKNKKYAENADKISELVLDAEIRADKIQTEAKKKAEALLRKAVETTKAVEKETVQKREEADEEVRRIIAEGRDRANRLMEAKLAERLEEKQEIEKQIEAQKALGEQVYAEICNKVFSAYKVMDQLTQKMVHASGDMELITKELPERLQHIVVEEEATKEEEVIEEEVEAAAPTEEADVDGETKVMDTDAVQEKISEAAEQAE